MSVSAQPNYVSLCGRCHSLMVAIGADGLMEHHCSLVTFDVTTHFIPQI